MTRNRAAQVQRQITTLDWGLTVTQGKAISGINTKNEYPCTGGFKGYSNGEGVQDPSFGCQAIRISNQRNTV